MKVRLVAEEPRVKKVEQLSEAELAALKRQYDRVLQKAFADALDKWMAEQERIFACFDTDLKDYQ